MHGEHTKGGGGAFATNGKITNQIRLIRLASLIGSWINNNIWLVNVHLCHSPTNDVSPGSKQCNFLSCKGVRHLLIIQPCVAETCKYQFRTVKIDDGLIKL